MQLEASANAAPAATTTRPAGQGERAPASPPVPTPLPLIYIVSSGRSGSTLLDLLLGQHPSIWTLGELQVLPWELREHRAPCACGQPLERCSFFGPLLQSLQLASPKAKLEHFRESHGFGRVWRWGLIGDLICGRPRAERRAQAAAYGELNARILGQLHGAAARQSSAPLRYLVDSSKDPYRLAWLASSGRFDLKVVHLYKDPRAFVHSMTRREGARPATVLRFALRWLIENGLMAYQGATLPPENFTSLNYASLAGQPEQTLSALGRFLGVEFEINHHQRLRQGEQHAISGNEMRWQQDALQLDERWRRDMPAWARWTTTLLTWPWWLLARKKDRSQAATSPSAPSALRTSAPAGQPDGVEGATAVAAGSRALPRQPEPAQQRVA
jgi:hypothetical protein